MLSALPDRNALYGDGIAVPKRGNGMRYSMAVKVHYRQGSRNCKQRARASVVRRSLKEAQSKVSV